MGIKKRACDTSYLKQGRQVSCDAGGGGGGRRSVRGVIKKTVELAKAHALVLKIA